MVVGHVSITGDISEPETENQNQKPYSAAELAHVTACGGEAIFKAVLCGFVQDSQAEKVGDVGIGRAGTERCA